VRAFLDAADASALARTSDPQGALARAFRIQALGTLVVLDTAGRVAYTGIDPPPDQITDAVTHAAAS
jgi:hypothetical protein